MVEYIRQNGDKRVQHPQVNLLGQTIQSWQPVETDLHHRLHIQKSNPRS